MAIFLLSQVDSAIVAFDIVTSEAHAAETEVTEHPVEQGSDITDHIRAKPTTLSFEAFVSFTPIARDEINGRGDVSTITIQFPHYTLPFQAAVDDLFDSITGTQSNPPRDLQIFNFDTPFDPVREVFEALETFRTTGTLLTAVTDSRTYEDMVIEHLDQDKSEPGGSSFKVSLKTIRTVQTASVKAPKPQEKRGAPKSAKGAQSPKDTADAAKSTSLILKGLNALGV